jgi:DNA-binding NarL/FixJ family response regulator
MPPFRVVLADDEILFLQSIKKNLDEIPEVDVIGQIVADSDLLEFLKKSPADLVIMDVHHQEQMEIVKQIKMIYPEVKILILTMGKSKKWLLQAILAHTDGYMLKENKYTDLITAIERIRKGGSYFCTIISSKMAEIIREEFSSKIVKKLLSAVQLKVFLLRCEAKSYKEIAKLLSLSPNTVRNYMVTIKHKLNLKTQADLIKYAIEQGHIQPTNIENGS